VSPKQGKVPLAHFLVSPVPAKLPITCSPIIDTSHPSPFKARIYSFTGVCFFPPLFLRVLETEKRINFFISPVCTMYFLVGWLVPAFACCGRTVFDNRRAQTLGSTIGEGSCERKKKRKRKTMAGEKLGEGG